MNRVLKGVMVCFILSLTLVMARLYATAQVGFGFPPLCDPPFISIDSIQVGFYAQDILVDNFEYWDSPYNHGWIWQETPSPYPVWGFGCSYGSGDW